MAGAMVHHPATCVALGPLGVHSRLRTWTRRIRRHFDDRGQYSASHPDLAHRHLHRGRGGQSHARLVLGRCDHCHFIRLLAAGESKKSGGGVTHSTRPFTSAPTARIDGNTPSISDVSSLNTQPITSAPTARIDGNTPSISAISSLNTQPITSPPTARIDGNTPSISAISSLNTQPITSPPTAQIDGKTPSISAKLADFIEINGKYASDFKVIL